MVGPIRWGLLGATRISPFAIIDPAKAAGNRLVAIAARDRERARAFALEHQIEEVFDSYQSVISSSSVDAIYNALPHGLHGYWNQQALSAGKHLLAEKPFAANGDEAADVAKTARASSTVVMEALHYFYHPVATRMRELVASGELGRIRSVRASFTIPAPNSDDIRWSHELAGGALMDLGCYCVHALRSFAPWLGGEPDVKHAVIHGREGLVGIDERANAALIFPSKVEGIISCNMAGKGRSAVLEVIGRSGRAVATEFVEPHLDDRVMVFKEGHAHVEHLGKRSTYRYQLDAFLAAVSSKDKDVFTNVDDSVATMRLIDRCYELAGFGKRLPTPPQEKDRS